MMHGCGTLFSSLWTPPSNQTAVINDFISHNTSLRCYGDGNIAGLFSCDMLVELEFPNIILRYYVVNIN